MKLRSMYSGKRRGFTLVESLLAMSVGVLGLTVLASVFPPASSILGHGSHANIASDACQKFLDQYREVGYMSLPTIPAGSSSTTVNLTAPSSLTSASAKVVFTHVDSSYAAATSDTGTIRADATVTWSGRYADKGTVTLSTLITP